MARIPMDGQKFGRLTVKGFAGSSKSQGALWLCMCDCGAEVITSGFRLRSGKTRSCGCYRRDATSFNMTTHGKSNSRLYIVWRGMKTRCYDTSSDAYKNYGGRGITVCDEWLDDFGAFRNWAISNGYDEDAPQGVCTIDRIDNDAGYSPENCRFVDMKVQRNNQRAVCAL